MKKILLIVSAITLLTFVGCNHEENNYQQDEDVIVENMAVENAPIEEVTPNDSTQYDSEFLKNLESGVLVDNIHFFDTSEDLVNNLGEPDIADFYLGNYYSYDENNNVFWLDDQNRIVLFGTHKYQIISNGMSEEEVISIIGEPNRKFHYNPNENLSEPPEFDESLLGYDINIMEYNGDNFTAIIEMDESNKVNVIWITNEPDRLIIR